MENKKEVLSFYDYNVGDKVEFGGEKYVVTSVNIDKTDPSGFLGNAGLSHLNSNGTYNKQPEFFIEAPTQALMIEDGIETDPNATVMDFDKIGTSIDNWSSFTNTFSNSVPKARENQGFKKLMDAGLENGFVASFDKNIENLVSALNQASGTMKNSLDEMAQVDEAVKSNGSKTLGGGRPKRTNDDYTKSSSSGPSSKKLVNNAKEQLEGYKKMSMNDLKAVAENLTKFSISEGKTLDVLLSDVNYSEKIKNTILKNQNISSELKKLIEVGDNSITQRVLLSIFNGTSPTAIGLDENTILTLRQYLNNIASSRNISLDNLINDKNNTQLLKNSLKQFGNVSTYVSTLNNQDINSNILNVYDGNSKNIDSSSMGVIRNYVDTLSNNNNTDSESLLTGNNSIVNEIQNLGKASVFAKSVSQYQDENIIAVLNNLFEVQGE